MWLQIKQHKVCGSEVPMGIYLCTWLQHEVCGWEVNAHGRLSRILQYSIPNTVTAESSSVMVGLGEEVLWRARHCLKNLCNIKSYRRDCGRVVVHFHRYRMNPATTGWGHSQLYLTHLCTDGWVQFQVDREEWLLAVNPPDFRARGLAGENDTTSWLNWGRRQAFSNHAYWTIHFVKTTST